MTPAESSPNVFRSWLDAFVAQPDRIKFPLAFTLAILVHLLVLAGFWAWPLAAPRGLTYSTNPAVYFKGKDIPPNLPKCHGGLIASYSVNPALPSGLILDATTGIISGKPTVGAPAATYTVTAKNARGASSIGVSIYVKEAPLEVSISVARATPTPEPKIAATPTPSKLPEKDEQLLKELFAQLPPEKQREYVDVEGLAKKKNTSKQALLESWRDSVAASRKKGTGTDPLPTLDGLENMEFRHLTNSAESIGKPQNPPESASATPPPTQGEMPSLFKPKPVDPNAQASNTTPETAVAATPTPTPTPTPMLVAKATPPPNILSVLEAAADQIPIFLNRRTDPNRPKDMANQKPEPEPTPTPQPTATPPPKPTPTDTSHPKPTLLPPPPTQDSQNKAPTRPQSVIVATKLDFKNNQPRPVPNPGYSPQMRRTKVNGADMPEGEDGVDSIATPLGRYKKAVSSAVGSRWNYYIRQRMSLLQTGKITAIFSLDARGKVRSFRIEENTSNRAHAALIEQAVREAEFDPPPPEALRNGAFEYPMSFHLL